MMSWGFVNEDPISIFIMFETWRILRFWRMSLMACFDMIPRVFSVPVRVSNLHDIWTLSCRSWLLLGWGRSLLEGRAFCLRPSFFSFRNRFESHGRDSLHYWAIHRGRCTTCNYDRSWETPFEAGSCLLIPVSWIAKNSWIAKKSFLWRTSSDYLDSSKP